MKPLMKDYEVRSTYCTLELDKLSLLAGTVESSRLAECQGKVIMQCNTSIRVACSSLISAPFITNN